MRDLKFEENNKATIWGITKESMEGEQGFIKNEPCSFLLQDDNCFA